MTTIIKVKILTRGFINSRATDRKPLPNQEEIRRQLGWDLVKQPTKATNEK